MYKENYQPKPNEINVSERMMSDEEKQLSDEREKEYLEKEKQLFEECDDKNKVYLGHRITNDFFRNDLLPELEKRHSIYGSDSVKEIMEQAKKSGHEVNIFEAKQGVGVFTIKGWAETGGNIIEQIKETLKKKGFEVIDSDYTLILTKYNFPVGEILLSGNREGEGLTVSAEMITDSGIKEFNEKHGTEIPSEFGSRFGYLAV